MKAVLFSIVLLLSFHLCFSQANVPDCNIFRKGTFSYRDSINNTIRTFVRKNKTQTEKDPVNKKVIKYKIKWLTECEYKLTQTWTNDKTRKNLNNSYIIYKVVPLTEKSFSYSCTCANNEIVTGVIVKMD
ncbi:MAG: hypothetical protein IPM85_04640 [Chitinophagaceae bacterium]|nr:hypothetical protein [Chitinophagaceae bacterium]